VLADNGRLRNLERIAKRYVELSMAYKGEVKVTVTSVIVSSHLFFIFAYLQMKFNVCHNLQMKFNVCHNLQVALLRFGNNYLNEVEFMENDD
jgi:F0F1-type ATP synthase delta subunit